MITLDDVTCSSPAPSEACEKLSRFGVARIPDYLTVERTKDVLEETRFATRNMVNYRNPYGPCCRFSLEQLPPHLSRSRDMIGGQYLEPLPPYFEQSRSAIAGDFSRSLCSTYLGSQGGFMEVVAFTRDWIPDPHAVYGKLHYDRRHQLKLILYLNDVDESNGAFGCIPASHKLGRDLFLDGWRRTLQLETTNALEIESAAAATEEDRPEYRLVPCVLANDAPIGAFVPGRDKLAIAGMAGTLIIFDTHLLHYGGFVTTPNKERWTLKGHTFAQRPLSN